MAGIYIHIPFCRQKCYYCDFYKTVNTSQTEKFVSSLKKEALLQKNYLHGEQVNTIYFGGGTPSVLTETELNEILGCLQINYNVNPQAEITLEANPDDLDSVYLQQLFHAGVNRLSVGIQSFHNQQLKMMNRRHDAAQAVDCIENAVKTGFRNISVDLIYGLPGLKTSQWQENLEQVFELPVHHLSAYHLTYHEGTPFFTWLKKGTLKELAEKESVNQFNLLIEAAEKAGFEQYEISNFAKNEMYSKHNTSYWNGTNYLGLGPSAHSYNCVSRKWNVAHLDAYIRAIENESIFYEQENLSENDKYNEYIITRIRTKWGVSTETIRQNFGKEKAEDFCRSIDKFLKSGKIIQQNEQFTLSRKGLFVSDDIMTNLIII